MVKKIFIDYDTVMTTPHSPISSESFYSLTPHDVLNAMESAGFHPTGQFLQLNSYENRVFLIFLETDFNKSSTQALPSVLVAKFYRPGRWSEKTILEEHIFLHDLAEEGFAVAAPLVLKNRKTLMKHNNLFYAAFLRASGRMPQELLKQDYIQIGKSLARLHNIGEQKQAKHRLTLTPEEYGWKHEELLKNHMAPEIRHRYLEAAYHIWDYLDAHLDPSYFIRIHGDCHKGNLLTDGTMFSFVDFDDFCNGPPVQDFWMLLSSQDPLSQKEELNWLLEGYETLRNFDDQQLKWIEPLRGLRLIHFSAWIAKRWEDPSFPRLFPEFHTYNYWAEETERLEKIAFQL